MTTTQRKSAPTADTVEGTSEPIQENDITQEQKYQDPDAIMHLLVPGINGDMVIYEFVKNHFNEFYERKFGHKPNESIMYFIKGLADLTDKAYFFGYLDKPLSYLAALLTDLEENSGFVEIYNMICNLATSAYQQGLAKQKYDFYRGAV